MKRLFAMILMVAMLVTFAAPALAQYKIYMTEESTRAIKRYSTLKKGSRGNDVRRMQERLADLGYLSSADVDGSYGNGTKDAVYNFQCANFLTGADGVAYPYTLYKLYDETAIPAWGITSYDMSVGDSGPEVLRLEKRLCDTGYLTDECVDSYFDINTELAVMMFQWQNNTSCTDGIACYDVQSLLFSYYMDSYPE